MSTEKISPETGGVANKGAFTDMFIRRPVLAIVVSILIVIAGLAAWNTISVRQYPRSDNAAVTVTTVYVGAPAELVRGFITTPLERVIAAADGIDYMESSSAQGVSTITARLKLNYDPNKALSEISSKVDQVRGDLPPEAEVPVINIESAESYMPSAFLSFTSDTLNDNEVTDYIVRTVQPRLSALEGVQKIDIFGARTFAMRVWLKADKMASLDISPAMVRQALAANNYLAALGRTKGALVEVNVVANTDLRTAQEFRQLVVGKKGEALVYLEDIAEVELGAESYDATVNLSGKKATFGAVYALPNANSLDVMKLVRAEMGNIIRELPSGMHAEITYDATEYIDDAINEVFKTLGETLLIVVIIIFLFLGSFRAVMVPVLAIPISLIGAVFLMQAFGFTLNLLTLLAIVLSVGLVVDDAIVVVENIERHLRGGLTPFQAAIRGARELVRPVVAMTITLVAVYAPIGFAGGLTGSLFREFAFTLAGAVAISGVVALTLSPMMGSRLLNEKTEHRWLPTHINAGFEKLRNFYGRLLDGSLSARPAVYIVWVALGLMAVPMYVMSPKELAPSEDQGVVFGFVEAPTNVTLDELVRSTDAAREVFLKVPEMKLTFQMTSGGGGFSFLGGALVPWSERAKKPEDVVNELMPGLSRIPGITLYPMTPPALPGGSNFPVEMVIASTAGTMELLKVAEELQRKAAESGMFYPGFPLNIDVKVDQPQAELLIDREKVGMLGLNLSQVGADVGTMLGGAYVNRFSIDGRSYKVIPQVERAGRLTAGQLEDIYVTGPDGGLVPLSSIATVRESVQPRSLSKFQQMNSVKLGGMPMVSLDEALKFLEKEARQIMPQGSFVDYTGESRQLREEGGAQFVKLFGFALALIFLVLAAQFNSFRDPFIILLGSVPLAMFGALVFTVLKFPMPGMPSLTGGWTTTLNIYSQIGLVTLVGLISKNGILIVQFANQLQLEGLTKLEAIRRSARVRLRPVLMTTAATIGGHFPLVLVTGAGAAARNSIGLVLVGGMAIGTLFTLFVVPSLYMLIAKDHRQDAGAKFDEHALAE